MKKEIISIILVGLSVLLPVSPALCAEIRTVDGAVLDLSPLQPRQDIIITGHKADGKFVTGIEPFKEFRLHRYTVVTFTNDGDVAVKIRLGTGKDCREVTEAMIRSVDASFLSKGCWVTRDPIPAGGYLQSRFEEPGRYPFEIEYTGETARETGLILIY